MSKKHREEDCQSELSNADSLDEVFDGTSSAFSTSSEDSLVKLNSSNSPGPHVENGRSTASNPAVNSVTNKKLVKQRSLIPQPSLKSNPLSKNSTTADASVHNKEDKSGNNNKGSLNASRSSTRENATFYTKNDVGTKRQCSVDCNIGSLNNHGQNELGQIEVAPIKENISSLKRKEIAHKAHHSSAVNDADEYLTPFQRKDKIINGLRAELKMAQSIIKEKEEEVEFLKNEQDAKVQEVVEQKNNCISELTKQLAEIHCSHDDLTLTHEEALQALSELRERVKELEEEMELRDQKHQEMYLRMYEKGKETALRERCEELQRIAKENPDSVSTAELLEKLKVTEDKLEWWQSVKRKESYDEGDKPETEADATLRFLQDSMFHYLTTPKEDSQAHMRAMIGIMGFTEPQKKKIKQAIAEKKKKNPELAHILNVI